MRHLTLIACLAIAATFAVSVAGSIRGRQAFRAYRAGVTLLTGRTGPAATALGTAVIGAEGAAAVLCLLPGCGPVGPLLAAALLLAFTAALARVVAQRRTGSCHCFAGSRGDVGIRHLVRNGVLVALAAAGAVGRSAGADAVPPGVLLRQLALDLLVAVVLVAVVLAWDDLVSLFVRPSP
jgi:hypothetical protein